MVALGSQLAPKVQSEVLSLMHGTLFPLSPQAIMIKLHAQYSSLAKFKWFHSHNLDLNSVSLVLSIRGVEISWVVAARVSLTLLLLPFQWAL